MTLNSHEKTHIPTNFKRARAGQNPKTAQSPHPWWARAEQHHPLLAGRTCDVRSWPPGELRTLEGKAGAQL